MGRGWGSLLLLSALASSAAADTSDEVPAGAVLTGAEVPDVDLTHGCEHLYKAMWPDTPKRQRLSLSLQVTDELTELGNLLGHHVNTLTNETLTLGFDGRKRRANFRIGLAEGPDRLLTFKLVGDVHFTKGKARATIKLDVGIGDRVLHVELRDVEMTHTNYRGDRGVALVIPVIRREF